jgi:hypothetical protein
MIKKTIRLPLKGFRIENFQYISMPGKLYSSQNMELYNRLFDFWKNQWHPVCASIKGIKNLSSDEFLRQKEVTAILFKEDIVGIMGVDHFCLKQKAHLHHSYFSYFPSQVLENLLRVGINEVLILNQLAVDKPWRGIGISDLLVGLAVKKLSSGSVKKALSYTRNTHKTNQLGYRWGGLPLMKNGKVHGEAADFILFYENSYNNSQNHPLILFVENLWLRKIDISEEINMNDRGKIESIQREIELPHF